jgi:hypothetical protein
MRKRQNRRASSGQERKALHALYSIVRGVQANPTLLRHTPSSPERSYFPAPVLRASAAGASPTSRLRDPNPPRSRSPPPSARTDHTPAGPLSACRSVATIWRRCTALLLVRVRGGQLAVQIQHGLDQRDHPIVARDAGGVDKVDRADGELKRYGRLPETLDWIGVKRRITGYNWNLLNDRLCNQ